MGQILMQVAWVVSAIAVFIWLLIAWRDPSTLLQVFNENGKQDPLRPWHTEPKPRWQYYGGLGFGFLVMLGGGIFCYGGLQSLFGWLPSWMVGRELDGTLWSIFRFLASVTFGIFFVGATVAFAYPEADRLKKANEENLARMRASEKARLKSEAVNHERQ